MLRKLIGSLCILLTFGMVAEAAIMGSFIQQSGVPGGVAFTSNEGTAPAPNLNTILEGDGDSAWVSYLFRIQTTAGETVSSINPTITTSGPGGGFHQRWNFNGDTETYTDATPSTNSVAGTSLTNGDSKLIVQGSLVLAPPTENRIAKANDFATSTPGFTTQHMGEQGGARNWGIGTTMTGNWGFTPAEQAAQAGNIPFGYLVMPRGQTPSLDIAVIFTGNDAQGNPLPNVFTFTEADFGIGGVPVNTPPTVDEEPDQDNVLAGTIVNTTFTATDATPNPPITFSNAVLSSFLPTIAGATNPAFNGMVAANGTFTWDTTGFARGVYDIDVTATENVAGPGNSGMGGNFQVTITAVPEPTTLTLIGLAMVGAMGFVRRRNG